SAQFAQMKPESAIFSDTGERIQSPADRLKALPAKLASALALYSPDHPDVLRMKREIAGLEAQGTQAAVPINDLRRMLEEARGELADLSKKYAADHPDVQRAKRKVDELAAELASPPAVADKTPGTAAAPAGASA